MIWKSFLNNFDQWSILALLRFILASIVSINHLGEYTSLGWMAVIPKLGAFGAILGFLLISGYSVCTSYSKWPEKFLYRRLRRLYPIYIASMLIMILITLLILNQDTLSILVILANGLFLNQLVT